MQRRILLVVFAALCGVTQAQRLDPSKRLTQYMLESYDRFRGLPQNTVHSILQTRDGFIWVGTYLGLSRFDGVDFVTYNLANTPELGSNGIFTLAEGRDGGLWIGTNGGGLVNFTAGRWTTYTTAQKLANNVVMRLHLDDRNRLWVGTRGGLSCLVDGKFIPLTGAEQLVGRTVRAFADDGAGGLWIGTTGGLFHFTGNQIVKAELGSGIARIPNVFDLHLGTDGTVWLGTDLGLISYNGLTARVYTEQDGLTDHVVNDVYVDHGGVLWAGTLRGGLNRLYQGRFTSLSSKNAILRDDKIQSLFEDREGNLWIGTEGAGLYRLREGMFLNYGRQEGYGADQTYAILQEPSGEMLFGTFNGGVIRRRPDGSFTPINRASGLPTDYVRALHRQADGTLWIGTYGEGIVPVRNGRVGKALTQRDGLSDNYIRSILDDGSGGLWIATRSGLSRYRDGKFTTYTTANGLPGNSVLCIATDVSGRLWVGTDGSGLARLDPASGKFDTLTTRKGLSSDVVMCLLRDAVDGSLWVGTNVGLDRVDGDKVFAFKTVRGLYSESIFQLVEDGRGFLWMGSNNGVYRVAKSDLLDLAAGRPANPFVDRYNEADGMRSAECKANGFPNAIQASDGLLWFPTFAGVSAINPLRLQRNNIPPTVVIDRVEVDGVVMKMNSQVLRVEAGYAKFEIEYTAPSFVSSDKVRFRYKLEGFDREWVEAGSRRIAYYTNVPPGDYTFRVIAANSDGVWNETGAGVRLTLEPTFFQSMWFYFLLVTLAVAITYGLYRWRMQDLRQRNDELEQLVSARTAQIQIQTRQLEEQADQLRRSNDEISRHNRVMAETNAELSGALERLSQTQDQLIQSEKHAALGQLVAGVAHEINTPVAIGITAASDLAQRAKDLERLFEQGELRKSDLSKLMYIVTEASQIIQTNLTRAADLIQSFKTVAVDQEQTDVRTVVLREYLDEILTSLGVELRQAGVKGVIEGHPTLEATLPSGALAQVVINLVMNAIIHAFEPADSRRPDAQVALRYRLDGTWIELTVSDNGNGIPPELIGRVFDPFYTTARHRGGTGLGLHIVYNLVTLQLHGSIHVSSVVKAGTTFTLRFPQRVKQASSEAQLASVS